MADRILIFCDDDGNDATTCEYVAAGLNKQFEGHNFQHTMQTGKHVVVMENVASTLVQNRARAAAPNIAKGIAKSESPIQEVTPPAAAPNLDETGSGEANVEESDESESSGTGSD